MENESYSLTGVKTDPIIKLYQEDLENEESLDEEGDDYIINSDDVDIVSVVPVLEKLWKEKVGSVYKGSEAPDTGHQTISKQTSAGFVSIGGEAPDTEQSTINNKTLNGSVSNKGGEAPDTGHRTGSLKTLNGSVSNKGGEAPDTGHRTGNKETSNGSMSNNGGEAPDTGHRTGNKENSNGSMSSKGGEAPDIGHRASKEKKSKGTVSSKSKNSSKKSVSIKHTSTSDTGHRTKSTSAETGSSKTESKRSSESSRIKESQDDGHHSRSHKSKSSKKSDSTRVEHRDGHQKSSENPSYQNDTVKQMQDMLYGFKREAEAREAALSKTLLSAIDEKMENFKVPVYKHKKAAETVVSTEYDSPTEEDSEMSEQGEQGELGCEHSFGEYSEKGSDHESVRDNESPRKKRKKDDEETIEKDTRVYLESLGTIGKFCPEALGELESNKELIEATEALRFIKQKPKPKREGLVMAKCFREKFAQTHKIIFDPIVSKDGTKDYGKKALMNSQQFLKPTKSKRRIIQDPLELRQDKETNPPILVKKGFKLFNSRFNEIQADHIDNACYQLNHLEWAQLSAVKKLQIMEEKYQGNSELARDIQEMGSIIDLAGNNLGRLESTLAALKSNVVLKERDSFLSLVKKDIPSELIKKARIQPILDNRYIIGQEVTETMAKTLETTASQFAYEIVKHKSVPHTAARRDTSYRGRGKTFRDNARPVNRQGDRDSSSTYRPQKSEDRSGKKHDYQTKTADRGRGFFRGGRGGSSTRRKPYTKE